MALNGQALNTIELNGDDIVTVSASGQLLAIGQTITGYLSEASAPLLNIGQTVKASNAGKLLAIGQIVRNSEVPDFYTRNGWDTTIIVGGVTIPSNQKHGKITVRAGEGDARVASFTIIPTVGTQTPYDYQGKEVKIYVHTAASTKCIFTGIVDVPVFNLLEEKITLNCIDKRNERINAELYSYVKGVGYYSNEMFGDVPESVASEMDNRLSTIPFSLDITGEGYFTLTSWIPKSIADITFTASQVYRRPQSVSLAQRGRAVNKINIEIQHRYQRLHHRQQAFVWNNPVNTICDYIRYGYTLPTRDMIRQAVNSAGWPVRNTSSFTAVFPAGFYNCNGVTVGLSYTTSTGSNVAQTTSSGAPVLDSQGNQVYKFVETSRTDNSNILCRGASWNATKRWAQTVEENYTLSVSSPSSITNYGLIEQQETIGVESVYDTSGWEDYTAFKNPPAGAITVPAQPAQTYYINQATNRQGLNNTINVALNKARTTILRTHREDRVDFVVPIYPEVELFHTVYANDRRVKAKGKVYSFTHVLDIDSCDAYTEIELALFKNAGSDSDSVLAIPAIPSDSNPPQPAGIPLQTHYGQDPTTDAAAKWTGYIGNKWISVYLGGGSIDTRKTAFSESFVVDTPAIEDAVRADRSLSSSASYTINIPNNNIIIEYFGTP